MKIKWRKLMTNFCFWAIAETTLNIVRLDTVADYSEFLISIEIANLSRAINSYY